MDPNARQGNAQANNENSPRICCETQTDAGILPAVPMPPAGPAPCCGTASGVVAGTVDPSEKPADGGMGRQRMRPVAWLAFLAVAGLLAAIGLSPGLKADLLRGEILVHLAFVGKAVWSILPYFILSVGLSTWAVVSGFAGKIQAVFRRREGVAIAGAALVGAMIPICSCGVIPLIAGLLAGGVPLGPVMAFWLSSPLMSPEMFVLTAGVLGTDYAVARLVAAVAIGAGAGYFISFLSARGMLNDQLQGLSLTGRECCASTGAEIRSEESGAGFWVKFRPEALKVTLFLGQWLLIAFLLESLIIRYVRPEWIVSLLGRDQAFSILLATAAGIPIYTSGVGAIPIVQGLLNSGMGPGAALAFLIAGPVTTIPAMTAVFALVKKQTFAIYLGAGIVGSLAAGYAYQLIAS